MCNTHTMDSLHARMYVGKVRAISDELIELKEWCLHQETYKMSGWYKSYYRFEVEKTISKPVIDEMVSMAHQCEQLQKLISQFARGIITLTEFVEQTITVLVEHCPVSFL